MTTLSRPGHHEHEAPWAQELSRAQSPAIERQAAFTEEKLRAEGHNLAEYRAEWAHFAAKNPFGGETIHQQYIQATNLAYARIVDDLMRKETGQGLKERHAPSLEEFERWMDEAEERGAPKRGRDDEEGGAGMRSRDTERVERGEQPEAEPAGEARVPSPRPLTDEERKQVQAEGGEAFLRGVPPAKRPADVPPEAWYAQRTRALEDDARASVEREVTRLSPLPQLSTAEAVKRAVEQTTAEFERPHEEDPAKLRTRLYALSLLHEAREVAERNQQPEGLRDVQRDIAEATAQLSDLREKRVREDHRTLETPTEPLVLQDHVGPSRTSPSESNEARAPNRDAEGEETERDFFPAERALDAYERGKGGDADVRDGFSETTDVRAKPVKIDPNNPRPLEDTGDRDLAKNVGRIVPHSLMRNTDGHRRPEETWELHTRDILEHATDPALRAAMKGPPTLPDVSGGRLLQRDDKPPEREPSLEERLSAHYRMAQERRYRELGEIAADGERAFFLLQREGLYDDQARQEAEAIEAAIVDVRASLKTHDPLELAERALDLQSREQSADPEHAKVLGRIRLAYASLATNAFYRQSLLLARMAKDCISEVQRLPEDDQGAFLREATLRLSEPAYNDRLAMGKELLRVDAQTATASERHLQRICAVARQAPSLSHLSGAAGWSGPAFAARVEAEVNQRLLEREHDPELHRALAERRVMWTLSEDENQKDAFFTEAKFIAEVLRRLPDARREQVETSPR